MHRNSRLKKPNETQQYAVIYLLLNYCTCFGRPSRPSSAVHKAAVAASGTDHTVWGASFFTRDQIRTGLGPTVICTKGCIYSFMYPWWWRPLTPETHVSSNVTKFIWSHLKKLAPHTIWSVPEAATTVLCTPDDGRPKHVQYFNSK